MTWSNVLPTSFLAILLALAFFALKHIIKSAIEADFAKDLEKLRADLKARDDEVATLRSNVMDGMAGRHAFVVQRRFQAIEALWASVCEKASLKALATFTERIKMDELLKSAKTHDGSRQLGKFLVTVGRVDEQLTDLGNIRRHQPFIPARVWTLYTAHAGILTLLALQAKMAAEGVGHEMSKSDTTLATVRVALPHMADFLDKFGEAALPHLVQPLEDKILELIIAWLEGGEEDHEAVRRAAKVAGLARAAVAAVREPNVRIPDHLLADPVPTPDVTNL